MHDWDIDLSKHWPGPGIVSFKEEAHEAAARIQELLGEERYAEVEREYQRLRKKHGSRIEWYQFFDGPRNLRELARRFNCRDRYDFLYRSWAEVSHALDISRFLTKTPDGPSMVKRLRDPGSIATFAGIAVTLLLEARRLMLGKFRPGEEASTKRWYIANIQGRFLTLARLGKPTE